MILENYGMRTPLKGMVFCLAVILVTLPGCAVIGKLGATGEPVNYALASNGAAVFASNFTPGHDPYTTINGITSSEGWDDGEGWESRFSRRRRERGGWSRTDPRSMIEYGSAWLEVQFAGPRSINKVTVYTLNSGKYPVGHHGIKEAWLQLWKEHGWSIVGEVKNGNVVARTSLERRPAGEKMVFKFDHTETEKMRFVVFRSNDVKTIGQGWQSDRRTENSVARVVEIEATGIGKISADSTSASQVEEAPGFTLEDLDGKWVRLSDFKGKIVIVTFWAAWSPQSQTQVRELSGLYEQYKDQDVVIIGISVDEGGAERVKPFVQRSNLKYTILIADTSIKSAYGGIGELPSTFVIDQKGNIFRKYFGHQGKHVLELSIKRLFSRESGDGAGS